VTEYDSAARSGPATLSLEGDIDVSVADQLAAESARALDDAESSGLVVDMQNVKFIDSTGLGALVRLRKTAAARGISMRLRNVPPQTLRVMQLTALDQSFDIER
jgi:anti-sigma B factor antagonist